MSQAANAPTTASQATRIFAWAVIAATFAFLIDNYLTFWLDWPGALSLMAGQVNGLAIIQLLLFVAAFVLPVIYVRARADQSLRFDADLMTGIATYIIRAAFWAVFLVGLADAVISFLRVEEMLAGFIGDDLAGKMNFNGGRAPYVHFPLIGLSLVIAAFTRSIGFHWLAMLVVLAELNIVLSRFIFSYEQAFMGDLVRFWYGALFLFASAYTLLHDGHVRVDVMYANFSDTTKGKVNAIGSIVLGILFCWVVLFMGMATKSSIINAPLISLEVSQSGFGMYVKYLMAGFLGVFAVSMMVQFCSYLLESLADWRGDPGSRLHAHDDELPVH